MKNKTKKEINWYGDTDNYIYLKFGDCRKNYHFNSDFARKYPDFTIEFERYFEGSLTEGNQSKFKTPFAVVEYVYKNKIPVHFYYNYTDTPAKNKKEIMAYLVRENSYVGDLTK